MTEAGGERGDLLDALRHHRGLFRTTVRHLDDAQTAVHPTVSELCPGGLVKHLAGVEREGCRFVGEGPASDEAVDRRGGHRLD